MIGVLMAVYVLGGGFTASTLGPWRIVHERYRRDIGLLIWPATLSVALMYVVANAIDVLAESAKRAPR